MYTLESGGFCQLYWDISKLSNLNFHFISQNNAKQQGMSHQLIVDKESDLMLSGIKVQLTFVDKVIGTAFENGKVKHLKLTLKRQD